ncbi:menaquinone biosynthesis protein [Thermosulfurimonas sp.]|uniref:menaquinone biosynthetic enzyme MqnA/MqnD family protein n=1 Tax=Thermosulfurimonas sp. TaxID=2080236 RepID=UPI0025EB9CC9|nr:menaquinone biosynthesis protein [Thermosulfurimonas sp.]
MLRFRVGLVEYFNTAPLRYLLPRLLPSRVEVIFAPPAVLNRMILSGDLEAGLVSSLLYAQYPEDLRLLPDLSISTTGRVESVLLFYRGKLEELSQKLITLTPESATSVALLRLLLEDFYGLKPFYLFGKPQKGAAGYLAIGDEALILRKAPPFPGILDLGGVWIEKTGLPFVFAVLAVRKETAERYPELVRRVAEAFYLSRAVGLARLEALLDLRPPGLTADEALNYLRGLEYDLSGRKQEALRVFFSHLARRGEIPGVPELRFTEWP